MSLAGRLAQTYFNIAYNQVYDSTTARLGIYQKLLKTCIGKLELRDNDKVLCVGLGTGNEVLHILQRNRNVNIVGVDYSHTALRKAYQKALMWGNEIEVLMMDARHLEFGAGTFDKVLCVHVIDFIAESMEVTSETLRVLKKGGEFVVTYPSEKEGAKLAANILKDLFHHNMSSRNHISGLLTFLRQTVMGAVYLPLLLRQRRFYSRLELQSIFAQLTSEPCKIEEYPAYQDFIVYGRKK
jgi:ubiquinone/menaquinone biosynthesis C-methylase UbiE